MIQRGIFAVGGHIQCDAVMGEIQSDVLVVKTGGYVCGGDRRPHSIQFGFQNGICNVIQHGHSVQQLILLHISHTQRGVQLRGTAVGDGVGQGVFCFGVVAGILIDLGQFDGHILVLTTELVAQIVKPGGSFVITGTGISAGLAHKKFLNRIPVVDEHIPNSAADQGDDQKKRQDPFYDFFHGVLLHFRV